jgi:hypothetical protein
VVEAQIVRGWTGGVPKTAVVRRIDPSRIAYLLCIG